MMMHACHCSNEHGPRFIVVTGGPGAGKTAVLELIRHHFCEHVVVLPEAATIVFGGGFPRGASIPARRAAQRAIFRVQAELERMTRDERRAAVVLCDRGTVDGLAYWPDVPETFWSDLGTTHEAELARYAVVIHLRTPPPGAYSRTNPLRIESAAEAARIDEKIADAWRAHPRRFVVNSEVEFMRKALHTLELLSAEVPPCCLGDSMKAEGTLRSLQHQG